MPRKREMPQRRRSGKVERMSVANAGKPIEIRPHKPAADEAQLQHKRLLSGPFWQRIPAYREVDEATFLDHRFQMKHTITKPDRLLATVLPPAGSAEPDASRARPDVAPDSSSTLTAWLLGLALAAALAEMVVRRGDSHAAA